MKILTGNQIREADRATIEREGISLLDLMERASEEIARWIAENVEADRRLVFCCGKGGNGGDGLAAARMLAGVGRECVVFFGADINEASAETRANIERLPAGVEVYDITAEQPDIEPDAVVIDALLGTGVSGGACEPVRSIIEWMNRLPNRIISIDLPSGMAAEWGSTAPTNAGRLPEPARVGATLTIVHAGTTLTLEFPKPALLVPETGECAGKIVVLPIDLDEKFLAETPTLYHYITEEWVESLRKPRAKFSHKGDYGHALLVCGSAAMPGAAILATGGALRSGCGLVTTHIPKNERFTLSANHPSAMLSLDPAEHFSTLPEKPERFSAVGVGCGLGQAEVTVDALAELLTATSRGALAAIAKKASGGSGTVAASRAKSATTTGSASARKIPMVLDADALNIIAANPRLKQLIPAGSVLTPHEGELRRLVGEWGGGKTDKSGKQGNENEHNGGDEQRGDKEKLSKASHLAAETQSVVIVKGAHSVVCTPDGRLLFNSTGTPGMAKGGSGDVLTGLITGLLARGYDAETASIIGVYAHGKAGEKAAEYYGEEAMNSADLAEFLS